MSKNANDYKNEILKKAKDLANKNAPVIEIPITMENGEEVLVVPSGYGDINEYIRTDQIDMIDYWLVHSSELPYISDDKLDKICNNLANYMTLLAQNEEEKAECKKYYDENHEKEDFDWSFYSDWHKDLFGYRPDREYGVSRHSPITFLIEFTFENEEDKKQFIEYFDSVDEQLNYLYLYDSMGLSIQEGCYVMVTRDRELDYTLVCSLNDRIFYEEFRQLEDAKFLKQQYKIKTIKVYEG